MSIEKRTWDWWRTNYDRFSFDEMRLFYELVSVEHPDQRAANVEAAVAFCSTLPPGARVLELGGYDGHLAGAALALNPEIKSWTNRELCPQAETACACNDARYHVELLHDWPWHHLWKADAFVSTHTIEHLKAADLSVLVSALETDRCLIEAPLDEGDRTDVTWDGYEGSHILEWEWGPVERCFAKYGYAVESRDGWVRTFVREEQA